jgi:hypothetical protein
MSTSLYYIGNLITLRRARKRCPISLSAPIPKIESEIIVVAL